MDPQTLLGSHILSHSWQYFSVTTRSGEHIMQSIIHEGRPGSQNPSDTDGGGREGPPLYVNCHSTSVDNVKDDDMCDSTHVTDPIHMISTDCNSRGRGLLSTLCIMTSHTQLLRTSKCVTPAL